MIYQQHFHNIYTTNLKCQVVIDCYCLGQKCNVSVRFKCEPIETNHL